MLVPGPAVVLIFGFVPVVLCLLVCGISVVLPSTDVVSWDLFCVSGFSVGEAKVVYPILSSGSYFVPLRYGFYSVLWLFDVPLSVRMLGDCSFLVWTECFLESSALSEYSRKESASMHPGYPWTTIYLWVNLLESDVLVVPTKQESGFSQVVSADFMSRDLPIPGISA